MFPLSHLPLFPLILMLIVTLLLIAFKRLSLTSKANKNKPPSPRKLPIIGNLHQIGSNPHRSLRELTQKHGPLVLIQLGCVPALVASSAEAAREILKTHDLIFASRPKLKITDTLTYGSKDIAFSPYGEYWRQLRSIVVLQLLSSKQVQSFRQVREDETRVMIDTIGKSCGSSIDLGELLKSLTNNIVCRVTLGRTYQEMKFRDLIARFTYLLGAFSLGNYIPWLSWVDRLSGLEAKMKKVAEEFDEFLEGVLEEHINKKRTAHGVVDDRDDEGQDLVDILLDAQRENTTDFILHRDVVKAAIIDLFAAGTDTTSTAIEWAISELLRNPRVMKKLRQEVKEVAQGKSMINEDDLEKMKYLQAVLKEALRLYTPSPLISRESTQYVKLMGYDIAAGTQVIVNAWAIGRDPSVWEDAEKFRPERFLNSSLGYIGQNLEYLPFGAGRRGCPGIQFAIVINELALANLVYRYDLALPDEMRGEKLDMSEITGLTLRRKSPLLVVATPLLY